MCIQARSISTKPGCMEEACEYGLTRGTCFVARRLKVVVVAGLLWIYSVLCCFSFWWDFVFFRSFSFLRAHSACGKYKATSCFIYRSSCTGWTRPNSHMVCLLYELHVDQQYPNYLDTILQCIYVSTVGSYPCLLRTPYASTQYVLRIDYS